eukprot:CAMPEP_0117690644 /NCGR_PEP_ID=MMETSP0804-20121206/25245_1 /TAXON_ID=1074897 /ORGANISM="Tetraselmis astigmatica, Strain CCMP880" /LENGTH=1136 /DNA_ID=CAMNT_0005503721 /DNA_START=227 /DNA_END=3639 /DNA_ORIENTATION=+
MSVHSYNSYVSGKTNKTHPEPKQVNKEQWWDARVFRAEEQRRAEVNRMASVQRKVFISHCWRKTKKNDDPDDVPDLQRKKREMISYLSVPAKDGGMGLAYWADFLDLLAEGPVPWRKEIEEGIITCSKVVCFVDEAWLLQLPPGASVCNPGGEAGGSAILDQEAWELLTVPGGPKKAWTMNTWGATLKEYEDQEIVPGIKFTQDKVDDLFGYLAGINLCPCRPLEEKNFGVQGLLENMQKYVGKDLIYFKQHAELKDYARKWDAGNRRSSLLLHRAEAEKWAQWVEAADAMGAMPPPTGIQRKFVEASMKQAALFMFRLRVAAVILLILILCGAAASGVMAVVAGQESRKAKVAADAAQKQRERAEELRVEADKEKENASKAQKEAERNRALAERDKERALLANAVSSSALLQSVVAPFVNDPVMLATETRVYIKASELLMQSDGSFLEQQLLPRLQDGWRAGYGCPSLNCLAMMMTSHADVDPRLLATGSYDGTVRVWNTASGEHIILTGHSSKVQVVEWSPFEATRLMSGSHDTTLIEWDITPPVQDPIVFRSSAHNGAVTALAWSSVNPGKVASGGEDNLVLVWSLGNQESRELVGHTGPITSLHWHPSTEAYLASAAEDTTARIWDMTTVNTAAILHHNSTVNVVAFSLADGGEKLATGSSNGQVQVWHTSNGTSMALLGNHSAPVVSLHWDKVTSGAYADMAPFRLGSVSRTGELKGWNFNPSLPSVAVDSLWPLGYGNSASNMDVNSALGSSYALDKIGWSEFNSSIVSKAWVIKTSDTSLLRSWKLSPGERVTLRPHLTDLPVTSVAFQSSFCSSRRMATATENGEVMAYSFANSNSFHVHTHTTQATALVWSPTACGTLAMSFSDASIWIWRDSDETAVQLLGNATAVTYLSYNPGGTKLAYNAWDGSVGSIRYIDFAASNVELLDEMRSPPGAIAWSPLAEGLMAAAVVADVLLWDNSSGSQSRRTLSGHTLQVESLAWSPIEHSILASGAYDNIVSVWNLTDGSRRRLVGHQGPVTSISWSPDGRFLASSSIRETTIRVWDTASWLVRVLEAGNVQEGISHVGFPAFNSVLVSSSIVSSSLEIWNNMDRAIGDWVITLKDFHDGNYTLTNDDLQQYGLSEALFTIS